ncbi:MAG: protein BatD [Desulfobacteraceae bacterium]|nr:protein BatD [Desulfobacteraceae bacterium]MBC2720912.1 protein BatD [Desulfobacteraceae bacterium]
MSLKKIFYIFCIFFLAFSANASADISIGLTLDRSSVVSTDTIVMKVTVTGKRKSSFPEIEGLSSFNVVKGGTASRLEFVNGSMSSEVEYIFYLTPLKPGRFVVGPAQVRIKNKVYSSNRVKLTVSKARNNQAGNESLPLFLEAGISKNNLYLNQNALYTLKLFMSEQVSDISLEMPEVQGLVFESLAEPKKYSTIINAKRYEVVELKYILIPKKLGEYSIPAAGMRMTVYKRNRRGSFFEDPFFNIRSGKPVYLSSNEIQLDVKNLPKQNRPDNFSGLIGRFDLRARLDPVEVKANESATLTISVQGRGNVRQIPYLKLADIKGLKIYQDKPLLNINKGESAISGEKIMKWAIVPEKSGEYIIPSMALAFFDPEKGLYRELKTKSFSLKSNPVADAESSELISISGDNHTGQKAKNNNKQEITRIGKDIFPVHTSVDPVKGLIQQEFFNQIFILLLLAPPFIFLALLAGRTLFKNNHKNRLNIRSRNAGKNFLKKVRGQDLSPEEIHAAVLNYLNTRFLLKGGLLTPNEVYTLLINRGASLETASMLKNSIAQIESVIFTGEKSNSLTQIQDELTGILKSVDQEVK